MSNYSSYDADALYTGASIGILLLSYGIAFLVTIIANIICSIPYYKMAKNAGIPHAWVAFIPFGYFYMATILPQKEFNLFDKFIWPNRAKAFWVYIISLVIYCVLITPMSLLAMIPVMICTLFTGHPVRRVFLCVIHTNSKENVLNFIGKVNGQIHLTVSKKNLFELLFINGQKLKTVKTPRL